MDSKTGTPLTTLNVPDTVPNVETPPQPASSTSKTQDTAQLPERLTAENMDTIQEIIQQKWPDISGLYSDEKVLQIHRSEARFNFGKRIVQVLNTEYTAKGEHWCLIVKHKGESFQLYDSDIEIPGMHNDTGYPDILKMKLAYHSSGPHIPIYKMNGNDVWSMYLKGPVALCANGEPTTIDASCFICKNDTTTDGKIPNLCLDCKRWFHQSCWPSIRQTGNKESWSCNDCEKKCSLNNDTSDLKENNNAITHIESHFKTTTKKDELILIYDINIGRNEAIHSCLAVYYPRTSKFFVYDYKKHEMKYHLTHDLEVAMVHLCWPEVLKDGGITIDIMKSTQQSNDSDCGVFTGLNAIHWSSENSLPSDYLQGHPSKELRGMLQDFMSGIPDKIPKISGKRDEVLASVNLNPTCKDTLCQLKTPLYISSIVDMFKCFICRFWFHNACAGDKHFLRVYRQYCNYCEDFWQLNYQSDDSSTTLEPVSVFPMGESNDDETPPGSPRTSKSGSDSSEYSHWEERCDENSD